MLVLLLCELQNIRHQSTKNAKFSVATFITPTTASSMPFRMSQASCFQFIKRRLTLKLYSTVDMARDIPLIRKHRNKHRDKCDWSAITYAMTYIKHNPFWELSDWGILLLSMRALVLSLATAAPLQKCSCGLHAGLPLHVGLPPGWFSTSMGFLSSRYRLLAWPHGGMPIASFSILPKSVHASQVLCLAFTHSKPLNCCKRIYS